MSDAQDFMVILHNALWYAETELRDAIYDHSPLNTTDTDPHVSAIELAKLIVQTVDRIKPR